MATQDLINFGVTRAGNEVLEELKEDGLIAERLDGYHFAVALALRQDLSPSNDDLTFTARTWNVGSVDATLTSIVQVLRPESEGQPFRYMRRLAESGLDEIRKRKAAGPLRWEDLLASPLNDVES
jgi:hypothetical protein